MYNWREHIYTDTFLYILRTAGLHGFSPDQANFLQADQNYALYVINLDTNITMATMLPDDLKESVGVMNAQGQQVMREDKNWLYLVGGYGWNTASGKNITYSKVRIAL